eukprot:TRINITY_DN1618_c0_g3_i1.p1 TRINITY_DN1618_c0_g3~~TRINITY_DN1618_c0_g3_i1.p1  ORF type:complete len:826 (-),score=122.69 TRINITY_DN1618_c0_g3_i1:505-2982(-)
MGRRKNRRKYKQKEQKIGSGKTAQQKKLLKKQKELETYVEITTFTSHSREIVENIIHNQLDLRHYLESNGIQPCNKLISANLVSTKIPLSKVIDTPLNSICCTPLLIALLSSTNSSSYDNIQTLLEWGAKAYVEFNEEEFPKDDYSGYGYSYSRECRWYLRYYYDRCVGKGIFSTLDIAREQNEPEILKLLLRYIDDCSEIPDIYNMLLEHGFEDAILQRKLNNNMSIPPNALSYYVTVGYENIGTINLLLDRGCDVNDLVYPSIEKNKIELLLYALKNGANISNGIVHLLVREENYGVLRLLFELVDTDNVDINLSSLINSADGNCIIDLLYTTNNMDMLPCIKKRMSISLYSRDCFKRFPDWIENDQLNIISEILRVGVDFRELDEGILIDIFENNKMDVFELLIQNSIPPEMPFGLMKGYECDLEVVLKWVNSPLEESLGYLLYHYPVNDVFDNIIENHNTKNITQIVSNFVLYDELLVNHLLLTNNYIVKKLLNFGLEGDYTPADYSGKSLLDFACSQGNLEIVKYIVEEKSACINQISPSGTYPILSAAKNNRDEILQYLLVEQNHQEIDLNIRDENYSNSHLFEALPYEYRDELYCKQGNCSICFCDETLYYISACGHRFCRYCLQQWLNTNIRNNIKVNISCPDKKCEQNMSYFDVIQYADDDSKSMYINQVFEHSVSAMEGFAFCPKCESGGFYNDVDNCGSCPNCDFTFCALCSLEYHYGWTCEEALVLIGLDEDNKNKLWVEKNSKKCPKCESNIEKNGGCSHISCRFCEYQFCWICGRKYVSGNYVYSEECNCAENLADIDLFYHKIPKLWNLE